MKGTTPTEIVLRKDANFLARFLRSSLEQIEYELWLSISHQSTLQPKLSKSGNIVDNFVVNGKEAIPDSEKHLNSKDSLQSL